MLEILHPRAVGGPRLRFAVLDFDGTLSLIREGWQDIMIPYFAEELRRTPLGRLVPENNLFDLTQAFVAKNTGRQTVYQCLALVREIEELGGRAKAPQVYQDEYHARLMGHIAGRRTGLQSGDIDPETLRVPGALSLLEMLRSEEVTLYLASGSDVESVREEAELLGLSGFFEGRIFGAVPNDRGFSKKRVVRGILRTHHLSGPELLGIGDGHVEIEKVREAGGLALGVASDEAGCSGQMDPWKARRLAKAGAHALVPDYRQLDEIYAYLFPAKEPEEDRSPV